MRSSSDMGSWRLENWSRWDHISREDNPRERMREFKLAVATARETSETALPRGSWRSNSISSSCTGLSATGFLLGFFGFPSSRTILWCCKSWSLTRDLNPGAGSVRMTAGGPSNGRSWMHRRTRASRNVWWRSSSITIVEVYDVTDSLRTSISCLERLRTSAAKEMPTASGGSHEDYSIRACGVWLKAAQEVQLPTTCSMVLSMSKAKSYRLVTILRWPNTPSFRARSCWCDSARAQGLQKQTCRWYSDHFICSMSTLSLLFFFVIERSVLMALVLYNKGMLEKVTTQRTQQFWIFPNRKNPVKCNACAVARKIKTDCFGTNLLISNDPVVRISRNLAK